MKDGKYRVAIAYFPYGGNGNTESVCPTVTDWIIRAIHWRDTQAADRLEEIKVFKLADTPITMTRNRAVVQAIAADVDFLFMVDSDMAPDEQFLAGAPSAKSFFPLAIEFLIANHAQGPHVIAAPYVGGPIDQRIHAYRWRETCNPKATDPEHGWYLNGYTREEAMLMQGVSPVDAVGTGLIGFDVRAFKMAMPCQESDESRWRGWFYYEWADETASEKKSTEDVTATRDIAVLGQVHYNRRLVYVAWDCWAGHWKPECQTKPLMFSTDRVPYRLRDSMLRGLSDKDAVMGVGNCFPLPPKVFFEDNLPGHRIAAATEEKAAAEEKEAAPAETG